MTYFISKPQASVQVDETWLVQAPVTPLGGGSARNIVYYYDHSGNRTAFYGDGEYADFTQTPHEQYRALKFQGDEMGYGPAAPKTEFTYTAPGNGHLAKVRDSWGRVTTYTWDEAAGVVVAVNMLLQDENDNNSWMRRIEYAYEVVGNQRVVTYMAFRTYDGRGNRIGRWFDLNYRLGTNNEVLLYQLIRPSLAGNVEGTLGEGGGKTTTYTYDSQNQVIRTSTPGEPDTTFSYGQSTADTGAGGPRVTQQQGDRVTVYEFSPEGWLRNRSVRHFNPVRGVDQDPRNSIWNGLNTMSWYDAAGHLLAQNLPSGMQLQYTYDRHGNRITEAVYPNAVNWAPTPPAGYERLTEYTYDNDNRLTRETQVARSGQGKAGYLGTASDASFSYGSVEKRYTYGQHDPVQSSTGPFTAVRLVAEDLYVAGELRRQFHTALDVYGRTTNTVLFLNGSPYKTVDYSYYGDGAYVGLVYPSSMTTPKTDGRTYDRDKSVRQYADQVSAKVSNGVRTEYLYDEYGNVARELLPTAHTYAWDNGVAKNAQRHHWWMYNGFGQPVWESMWEYLPEKDSWPQLISRQWAYYASGELDASWEGTPDRVTDYRYYMDEANRGRLAAKVTGVGSSNAFGVNTPHETINYTYDGYGRPNATNVDGFTTTLTYDSLDRVVQTVNPDGSYRKMEYDSGGNLHLEVIKNVGAPEQVVWHEWDTLGREVNTIYPEGTVRTYYDAFDRPVKITDNRLTMNGSENDRSTYLVYDTAGNLGKELGPALVTAGGQPYTDARRPYAEYGYDQMDRRTVEGRLLYGATITPSTMTFPNGAAVAWTNTTYDVFNRPTKITNAEGYESYFSYDNGDNLTTVSKQVWKGNETDRDTVRNGFDWVITRTAYDALAHPVQQVDARGNSRRTTYGFFGPTMQVDERNIVTKVFTYTPDGLLEGVWEPDNNTSTTAQYGSVDRWNPGGTHVRVEYREYDNRVFPARIYTAHMNTPAGPSSGALTSYVYNDQGKPTRTTLPPDQGGATATIEQDYDNTGNVLRIKDANGFPTTFTYDWAGRLVGKQEQARPGNQTDIDAGLGNGLSSSYRYDATGNLTYKTEHGLITEYRYNSLGKVISESRPRVGDGTGSNWKLRTYRLDGLKTAETSYDYSGNLASYPNVISAWDANVAPGASGNITQREYDYVGNPMFTTSWGPWRAWEKTEHTSYDGVGNRYKRRFWGSTAIYAEQRNASGAPLGHGNVWTYWRYDSNRNLIEKWDTPGNSSNEGVNDPNDRQNVFTYTYSATNKEAGQSRTIQVKYRSQV
ncbi:RHS repeat domain-containing protein, partial [Deinococcus metallilatus]|uniref:RHS repeat domain-containing protein n=1 Tax=Deinococcus metallilatus TaxID=1211322 RepID=UPI00160DC024